MRSLLLSIFLLCAVPVLAAAATGMVDVKSSYSVKVTADRLEDALRMRGMTLFNRIDHAADTSLRPTILMIFGNPAVGTPLIACQQTIAIDMPQKALIWQDQAGKVWFSYNDPEYLVERHQAKECGEIVEKISAALATFARLVTGP